MSRKFVLFAAIAWIILLGVLFFMLSRMRSQSLNIERLESNISAMADEVSRGLSSDNKNTATIKQQTLTKEELKEVLQAELKTLDIKARDVKNVTNIITESKVAVQVDTVVKIDTLVEYSYKDAWVDIAINQDSAKIACRDSLLVVNHAKTKRFLWWTWKRYSGKTTIKNYSPYTYIENINSIDVEDK